MRSCCSDDTMLDVFRTHAEKIIGLVGHYNPRFMRHLLDHNYFNAAVPSIFMAVGFPFLFIFLLVVFPRTRSVDREDHIRKRLLIQGARRLYEIIVHVDLYLFVSITAILGSSASSFNVKMQSKPPCREDNQSAHRAFRVSFLHKETNQPPYSLQMTKPSSSSA